jgi:hypothetical protein
MFIIRVQKIEVVVRLDMNQKYTIKYVGVSKGGNREIKEEIGDSLIYYFLGV